MAILDASIPPSSRLPASRDLAKEIGISRNTVFAAYEQLQAEGYIQTRTGSGTFVNADLPEDGISSDASSPAKTPVRNLVQLSKRGTRLLGAPALAPHQWGAFMPGVPDVTRFPHDIWRKLQNRLNRKLDPAIPDLFAPRRLCATAARVGGLSAHCAVGELYS